ncbi:14434_t:CDS:2 [Ambispora leptoticha]|uniref:14434_t:CDS:1 n=1 Tax=Ambispora leptoticha TaxID=144679 RepID=A0A9N8YV69_9GLOM|nr:14434_t:CDS:2 [Ambispora leptoticha]
MDNILNFRDVGKVIQEICRMNGEKTENMMKSGVLFRAAKPDDASDHDIKRLLEYDIHTIIDLRSGYENTKSDILASTFPLQEVNSVDFSSRKTIKINLNGSQYAKLVLSYASRAIAFQIIGYFLICQKHWAAQTMATKVIGPLGLGKMYSSFFEGCHDEVRKIFQIMTDKQNLPLFVHCTYGKDRTGFIIALTLSLLGIPDEVIITEYSQSHENLLSLYPKMIKDMGKIGLGEGFAIVDPKAMRQMLEFLHEQYGTASDYLSSIGFEYKSQQIVIKNLCE